VTALPVNGYTTPNQGAKVSYSGGNWAVSWVSPQSQYFPPGTAPQWSMAYGLAYISISLPKTEGFLYSTYGLCGYFNGNPADDFTNVTDYTYLVSVGGTRYNGGGVLPWGADMGVAANGWWTPLGNKFHHWTADGAGSFKTMTSDTLPPIVNPDANQQAALGTLTFASVPWMAQVQASCEQYDLDIKQYENCVYDGALMNDLTLAQANSLAVVAAANMQATVASQQPQNTQSVNNKGTIAGAVCGAIGGLLLIAAVVFFCKFRQVKSDMSRALIVRENGGATAQVQL